METPAAEELGDRSRQEGQESSADRAGHEGQGDGGPRLPSLFPNRFRNGGASQYGILYAQCRNLGDDDPDREQLGEETGARDAPDRADHRDERKAAEAHNDEAGGVQENVDSFTAGVRIRLCIHAVERLPTVRKRWTKSSRRVGTDLQRTARGTQW